MKERQNITIVKIEFLNEKFYLSSYDGNTLKSKDIWQQEEGIL